MRKQLIALFILLAGTLLSACADDTRQQTEKSPDKLSIYTTVYPLQFFAERIGGEHAEVHTIYPPGADEHTFEPSQKDMIALAESDLFFYIGLGLEGFAEKAKTSLKNEDVTIVAAADKINLEKAALENEEDGHEEDEHGHSHSGIDPHIWLDPVYAKELAKSVMDGMAEKMPENRADFEKNYQKLIGDLDQLDKKFKVTASSAKNKEIIVSHAAFGYWESRYGIRQTSIAGMSTASEPTQKDMEKIISTVRKNGIKYILVEQNVSSKLAQAVHKETGAKIIHIHNLATRTDKDIANKETYLTLMEQNVDTLKKAMN
ncbi:metal ABC transporter solute-binding protein, Zn/Mn family [Bacillus sp. B-jedd]|uniref:metal ABC transporter solute-binding protein, Zn/Mn family n=1 Tax=Bacillus sp. B-jedd TaxID=1476857 RepID=UPI000515705D|nr:metal ion ABC transporter periplasmic protein [Bacillus sp. B-jedd]